MALTNVGGESLEYLSHSGEGAIDVRAVDDDSTRGATFNAFDMNAVVNCESKDGTRRRPRKLQLSELSEKLYGFTAQRAIETYLVRETGIDAIIERLDGHDLHITCLLWVSRVQ